MGSGADRDYGMPFGANVVLPKQLLLEAVQEVVRRRSAGRGRPRQRPATARKHLSEGYEGVGWTIFKAGRQLDPMSGTR